MGESGKKITLGLSKYKKIPEDNIPFGCYVDRKTILNKNGEILQTLAIYFYDNKYNSSGQFRQDIEAAIKKSSEGFEPETFSFWIHNIRSRNQKIINTLKPKDGDFFLIDEIEARWNEDVREMNYYDSMCYITILHPCIPLQLSITKIYTYLNGKIMSSFFKESIEKGKKALNIFTARFYNSMVSKYFIERLEMKSSENFVEASHLNLFSKLINFDNVHYKVPMVNLGSFINKSQYNFGFGEIEVEMGGRTRYATIFTLKDPYSMVPDVFSKLMSQSQDVITCEIFHQVDKKRAYSAYKKEMEYFFAKYEKEHSKLDVRPTLNAFDYKSLEEKAPVYTSYAGFMLIAGTRAGLSKSISKFCQSLKDLGIVVGQEDIGTERAFYSFLPGNFRFIKHSNIVQGEDIGKMAYAYNFDNENVKEYKDKKIIMVLPTVNNHAYAFGIMAKKPNILITDAEYRNRTIFHNIISLKIKDAFDSDVYIIDMRNHSSTVAKFMEGNSFEVHKEGLLSVGSIHAFEDYQTFDKTKEANSIASILTHKIEDKAKRQALVSQLAVDIAKIKEVKDFDEIAKRYSTTKISETINEIFSSSASQRALLSFERKPNETGFYTYYISERAEVGVKNFFLKSSIDDVLKRKTDSGRYSVVVINNPFVISQNQEVADSLKRLIEQNENCVFIFSCNNQDVESIVNVRTNLLMEDLNKNCETFIHIGNEYLDEKHKIAYGLTKAEFFTMEKIKMTNEIGILKQNGLITPIKSIFPAIGGFINTVLCDTDSFRKQVQKYFEVNPGKTLEECFDFFLEQESLGKVLANINFEEDLEERNVRAKEEKDERHKRVAEDIFDAA